MGREASGQYVEVVDPISGSSLINRNQSGAPE